MIPTARGIASVLLVSIVSACSEQSAPPARDSSAASDTKDMKDMKDMPGMAKPEKAEGGEKGAGEAESKTDGDANTVTFTAAQIRNGKVRWEAVVLGTAVGTAAVPGQVVPNEDHTSRMGSPASGRVIAVRVSPGQRVARGQVLVTLASPEAGMAQADVAKAAAALTAARAQAAYATSARERAERLLALKAIPRQDYERAVADDAAARATLAQASAEAARARSTAMQLGGSDAATGEIAVRSPLNGVVLQRTAVPGAVVETGAPLVVVTDPSSLWLTVNAPESLVGAFRRGGELRFSVPAYPGETFTAHVDAVGAGLDPGTRTLPVRAVIAGGAAGGRLKPEMLANVAAVGGPSVPAVLVPEDAVQNMDGKQVVFVAVPDSVGGARFTARTVETGARGAGRIAVVRGLTGGDVVVTAGAFRVKAQLKNGSMPDMDM